jgi:hypothetical protein
VLEHELAPDLAVGLVSEWEEMLDHESAEK